MPTPPTDHQIWKEVYEHFEHGAAREQYGFALCPQLEMVVARYYHGKGTLPKFYAMRDHMWREVKGGEDKTYIGDFWWESGRIEPRRAALLHMIEVTRYGDEEARTLDTDAAGQEEAGGTGEGAARTEEGGW